MTTLLAAMLGIDAILHGLIIARFGLKGNEPPLVFGIAYAALTVAALLAVPYAPWAALVVTLAGSIGLIAAFKSIPHEKTIERVILALNAILVLTLLYLLFAR